MKTGLWTVLFALIAVPLWACAWDHDTLQMERQEFPSILEMITGKFLRHSKPFYRWRIEDRLKKLKGEPKNLAYYDDLGVAYDKIGRWEKGVEMMRRKEAIQPGLYKTYANLGTFYIHGGKLEKGMKYIEKAIEINPDAHFGREVYQLKLVAYLLEKKRLYQKWRRPSAPSLDGMKGLEWVKVLLPLAGDTGLDRYRDEVRGTKDAYTLYQSFEKYLRNNMKGKIKFDRDKAVQGVVGMVHFGKADSPVLMEVLGHLLHSKQARRLAARAYLRASYLVGPGALRDQYRQMAAGVISMQVGLSLERLEGKFQTELAEADEWVKEVFAREKEWIESGKNPEVEFDRMYYKDPEISSSWTYQVKDFVYGHRETLFLIFIFSLLIALVVIYYWRKKKEKREGDKKTLEDL